MQVEEHIPLAQYTTFHIGGPARYFARVHTAAELQEALVFTQEKKLPIFILGGGSNLLVRDLGFDGLVIKIEILGVELEDAGDDNLLIAGAGESWDALVQKAVAEHLWGIENLSGIPGTAGGAVVQNIGAYGAALSQTLEWVETFDMRDGATKRLTGAECAFGYRDSIFKHSPHLVATKAAFRLTRAGTANTSYKDLAKLCNDSSADIRAVRMAVLEIRKGKFPDLAVEGTAGSYFKNPIVEAVRAGELAQKYPAMPQFEMPETSGIKIPLAWLLDHALSMRGASAGGARLYEKQLLVIAAQKNTPSRDVEELARAVQLQVKKDLGIDIEPEVRVI